jgi:hypothetical protein
MRQSAEDDMNAVLDAEVDPQSFLGHRLQTNLAVASLLSYLYVFTIFMH